MDRSARVSAPEATVSVIGSPGESGPVEGDALTVEGSAEPQSRNDDRQPDDHHRDHCLQHHEAAHRGGEQEPHPTVALVTKTKVHSNDTRRKKRRTQGLFSMSGSRGQKSLARRSARGWPTGTPWPSAWPRTSARTIRELDHGRELGLLEPGRDRLRSDRCGGGTRRVPGCGPSSTWLFEMCLDWWRFSVALTPPRSSSCLLFATKLVSSGATSAGLATSPPTVPCSPPSADCSLARRGTVSGSHPRRCSPGTAGWSRGAGPIRIAGP